LNSLDSALEALKTGDFQSRWQTAKEFPALGEAAVPPLISLLNDAETDEELVWFIVKILGSFRTADAIFCLVALLDPAQPEDISDIAAQMLAGVGPEILECFTPLLDSPTRQLQAVQAIAQIDHSDAVPLLLKVWSQQPEIAVRKLVLEALDKFRDPALIDVFLQGIRDSDSSVRKAAIIGLTAYRNVHLKNGDDSFVSPIVDCLADEAPDVADQAARALGQLGTDAAITALVRACCQREAQLSLQRCIVQSLGWIGSPSSLDGLMQIWQSFSQGPIRSEPLLKEVLLSLSRTKDRPRAVAQIVALLQTSSLQASLPLQSAAAFGLGRLADTLAVDPLIEMLANADYALRLQVIAALKQLAPEVAYEKIQARSDDPTIPANLAQGLEIAIREW
jgi:HEAT repeat protein